MIKMKTFVTLFLTLGLSQALQKGNTISRLVQLSAKGQSLSQASHTCQDIINNYKNGFVDYQALINA